MPFSTSDTIVAIATPPGRGGIGVVRLSGPEAPTIAHGLTTHAAVFESRRATLTKVRLTASAKAPASLDEASRSRKADTTPGGASGGAFRETGAIDHAVVTFFPAPHSYTGEDVVELSAHGSPVVLRAIVSAALAAGARLAEPGEFTLRAFLNGRIDLVQAEAVADLVDAVTPIQARAAFDQLQGTLTEVIAGIDAALFDLIARLEASVDFPDEGFHFVEPGAIADAVSGLRERTAALLADARRGRLLREGLLLAIVGKPNVGKSSLFNALVGAARAIVTDVPGTTRDLVTEAIDLGGLRITLVDTAGLHETADHVEAEGVARARRAHQVADLTVVLLDRSQPLDDNDLAIIAQTTDTNRLIVVNKIDLPAAWVVRGLVTDAVPISATTAEGLDFLRARVMMALDIGSVEERPEITNIRHVALVERVHAALTRAVEATRVGIGGGSLSEEFVLADLQDARAALEEMTGRRAPDDLLAHIFSRFCLGK